MNNFKIGDVYELCTGEMVVVVAEDDGTVTVADCDDWHYETYDSEDFEANATLINVPANRETGGHAGSTDLEKEAADLSQNISSLLEFIENSPAASDHDMQQLSSMLKRYNEIMQQLRR